MLIVTLLTLFVTLIAVAFMAIGVVFRDRPLRGSCGGNPEECLCAASGKSNACGAAVDPALRGGSLTICESGGPAGTPVRRTGALSQNRELQS